MTDLYLADDIGGTKTVLAFFSTEKGPFQPIDRELFPSHDYASLDEIVKLYLSKRDAKVLGASFGVAGPVQDGRAEVTNLPWVIDSRHLSALIHNAPVRLLNDLSAIAHAVPYLNPEDLYTNVQGEENAHNTIGVIAPGTGLGEAFLTWNGNRYETHPPEAGHARLSHDHTVDVGGKPYTYRKLILATGASPWAPPISGLAETPYLTNTTALELNELPRSMIAPTAMSTLKMKA